MFALVYGTCNWLASQRTEHLHLYFDWERQTPFIPSMILLYGTVYPVTLFPVFFLTEKEIKNYAISAIQMILLAGVIFFFFPAVLPYQRPEHLFAQEQGFGWGTLYRHLWTLDQPFNNFPSLHVAFGAFTVLVTREKLGRRWQVISILWLISMCASVLLTHQHQVSDIAGGLLLSGLGYWRYRTRCVTHTINHV